MPPRKPVAQEIPAIDLSTPMRGPLPSNIPALDLSTPMQGPLPDATSEDPYSYLLTLPRGKGMFEDNIRGMTPAFARQFAGFSKAVAGRGGTVQFTATTGGRHSPNSHHYAGNAADFWIHDGKGYDVVYPQQVLKDAKGKISAADVAALARKHGMGFIDEYANPSSASSGPHFHANYQDPTQPPPPVPRTPKRMRRANQLEDTMDAYSAKYGVPKMLMRRLFQQESGYIEASENPSIDLRTLRSSAGAQGISQMMPDTKREVLRRIGRTEAEFDSSENVQIQAGTAYFQEQLKDFRNTVLATAAYNAGPGNAERFRETGRVDIAETRNYLANIFRVHPDKVDGLLRDPKFNWTPADSIKANAEDMPIAVFRQMRREMGMLGFMPAIASRAPGWSDLMAGRLLKPAEGEEEGGTVDDSEWSRGLRSNFLNNVFVGLPNYLGFTPTGEYEKYKKAPRNYFSQGQGDMSERALNWIESGGGMLAQLPVAAVLAEAVVPAVASKFATKTGLTALAGGLVARSAAGRLPQGTNYLVNTAYSVGGMEGVRTMLKWGAVGFGIGFNDHMGKQFADNKGFNESIPGALSHGMNEGLRWLAGAAILPFLGAFVGKVGTTAMQTMGTSREALAAWMGTGVVDAIEHLGIIVGKGPEAKSLAEAGLERLSTFTAPMTKRADAAGQAVYNRLEKWQQDFWSQFAVRTIHGAQQLHQQAIWDRAYGQSAQMLSTEALDLAKTATRLGLELKTVQREYADKAAQVQHWSQFKDTFFKNDPDVPRFANLLGLEKKLDKDINALYAGPQTPQAQKQISMLQARLGQVQTDLGNLRQGPMVKAFEVAGQKKDQAVAALAEVANSKMWQNQDATRMQIEGLRAQRDLVGALASKTAGDRAAGRMPELSDGPFFGTELQPIFQKPGISNRQQKELGQYYSTLLKRARNSWETTTPTPQEILALEGARSNMDGVRNPRTVLGAMQGQADRLVDYLTARGVKVIPAGQGKGFDFSKARPRSPHLLGILNRAKDLQSMVRKFSDPRAPLTRDMKAQIAAEMKKGANLLRSLQDLDIPIGPYAGPFREKTAQAAFEEPWMMRATADAHTVAAAEMLDRNFIPKMGEYTRFLEQAAEYGNFIVQPDGVVQRAEVHPFMRELADNVDAAEAMSAIISYARQTGNSDEIRGVGLNAIGSWMGMDDAARIVAVETAEKQLGGAVREALKLKKTGEMPKPLQQDWVRAVEGDKAAMDRILTYSDPAKGIASGALTKPMGIYLQFQAMLERYKLWEPNMSEAFRQHYFMHIYPRIRRFLGEIHGGAADDVATLSTRLSSEKRRTFDTVFESGTPGKSSAEGAYKEARDVYELLKGSPPKDEAEELTYLGLMSDEARAAFLYGIPGKQVDAKMVETARSVKWGFLVAEAVTDPIAVTRQAIESTLVTANARRFLQQMMSVDAPEMGGRRLIEKISGERGYDTPAGLVHKTTFGKAEKNPYNVVAEIPGMAGYEVNGISTRSLAMHPQLYHLVMDRMTPTKKLSGVPGAVQTGIEWFRRALLTGTVLVHDWNIYSNMYLESGLSAMQAAGLAPAGRWLQGMDVGTAFRTRAIRAGLKANSAADMVKTVTDDMVRDPRISNNLGLMYGANPTQPPMGSPKWLGDKLKQMTWEPVRKTGDWLMGGDEIANKFLLFNAITDAQFGAWGVRTAELWHRMAPDLLQRHSMSEAMLLVEQQAASEINKAAGVTAQHLMSTMSKQVVYNTIAAPNWFATQMRMLVEGLDGIVHLAAKGRFPGYRSGFDAILDPAMKQRAIEKAVNFMGAGVMADILYAQLFSILVNGHTTFANTAPGRQMQVAAYSEPDGQVHFTPPFFGMHRAYVNSVAHLLGGDAPKAVESLMGKMNSVYTTIAELVTNRNKFGQQIAPGGDAFTTEYLGSWTDYLANHLFQLDDPMSLAGGTNVLNKVLYGHFGPTKEYPVPGTPVRTKEALLNAAGAFASVPTPDEIAVAKGLEKHLAWSRNKMDMELKGRLREWLNIGPQTKEGEAYLQKEIVAFALDPSVSTVTIPNAELRETYSRIIPNNPEGKFVLSDARGLKRRIQNVLDPESAAYHMVPKVLEALLDQKIREAEKLDAERQEYREEHLPAFMR